MKKVLILTYYWPPSGGAGVQRWLKFVKYLREFGWEPVVYTHLNGEVPVIDHSLEKDVPKGVQVLKTPIWEPYGIYKKFIGRKKEDRINASFLSEKKKAGVAEKISVWIRGNYFIPDARKFWIKPSIVFLRDHIRKEKITHIVSSGPPHSMHLIALGLKKEFPELKWLADFRDPWTNIDYYDKLMLSGSSDRKHRALEMRVLSQADAVVSIGRTMSDEFYGINQRGGQDRKDKFKVITNGYDEEDVSEGQVKGDEHFTLAHIGTLVKDRNPDVLWKVLAALLKEDPGFAKRMKVKLVGKVDVFVKEEIEKYGLKDHVSYTHYLPHAEVILEQKKASVLLLLVNDTPNSKGILTGKFFEYLASGRPILAIGPTDGDLAEIMNETGAGMISGFKDEAGLKEHLLQLFSGHEPKRDPRAIEKFSRRSLTKQLADLLNTL